MRADDGGRVGVPQVRARKRVHGAGRDREGTVERVRPAVRARRRCGSPGLVTDPMTGPRSCGVAAPQRMGKRATPPPGSGCEVRRMWPRAVG
jgi:hypothetical protein